MPRDEVAFLGILLFSMLDVNLKRDPFSLHPCLLYTSGSKLSCLTI